MAAKFSVQIMGKKDCFAFNPDDIQFSAFTGRKERTPQQIEAMVESLLQDGQEQPITYRKGFDGKPIAVTGHTRILAARAINERRLQGPDGVQYGPENPFVIYGVLKQFSDLEAVFHTFRENDGETRTPINDVDLAFLIRTLGDSFGLKDAEIAKRLRKDEAWVSRHRAVLDLDDSTQKQITSGGLTLAAALAVGAIEPASRPAAIEQAKAATGGKVTAAAVASAARQMGAKTSRSLPHTDSEFKAWVALRIAQRADTPSSALEFLRAVQAFRAGNISEIELTTVFEAALTHPQNALIQQIARMTPYPLSDGSGDSTDAEQALNTLIATAQQMVEACRPVEETEAA